MTAWQRDHQRYFFKNRIIQQMIAVMDSNKSQCLTCQLKHIIAFLRSIMTSQSTIYKKNVFS